MPLSLGLDQDLSTSHPFISHHTMLTETRWTFGSDKGQVAGEIELLQDFLAIIQEDTVKGDHSTTSLTDRPPAFLIRGMFLPNGKSVTRADLPGFTSLHDYNSQHDDRVRILRLLIESEISRLTVWRDVINTPGQAAKVGQLEKSISNVSNTSRWLLLPADTVI